MELTKQQQAIVDLLWPYLKKDPDHPDRVDLPGGSKSKLGFAETVIRVVKHSPDARFNCPKCGPAARIEETVHCDGIKSTIVGIDENGLLRYGEGCAVGDVVDITYQCGRCGQTIVVDSPDQLIETTGLSNGKPYGEE